MVFRVNVAIYDSRLAKLFERAGEEYNPEVVSINGDEMSDLEIVRAFCALLDSHEGAVEHLKELADGQ